MRFSNTVLFSVFVALTCGAPVQKRGTPSAPRLDFTVVRSSGKAINGTSALTKRRSVKSASDAGVSVTLDNEYSFYLASIELGTPGQSLQVDVDTGSSDLWVPGSGTTSSYGTYDSSDSSTYSEIDTGFSISYGDGSSASGVWGKETLTIGGVSITDIDFGYATTQNVGQGLLGVGMKGNEASETDSPSFSYDNLPLLMADQGIITKAAYSLYLNSQDATAGSILFGAVDKAKYSGDLATLSLVDIDDEGDSTSSPVAFFVNLDEVASSSKTYTTTTYPALLDSGTTLIYAPSSIAAAIGKKYGTYSSDEGGYVTSCDTTGEDLTFTFDSATVTVPFADILYDLDSNNQCLVGVLDSDAEYYILGDGFLRSAYVLYNIADQEIGIAQASYSTDTDIVLVS